MILEVRQTTSVGDNNFEILEQGRVIYKSTTPFFNPAIPLTGDSPRRLTLTDPSGNIAFSTHYEVLENLKASVFPLSYLFTGSRKVSRYRIADSYDNTCGAFYIEENALMNWKMVIEYQDRVINGYKRSVGDRDVVSFYQDDIQIGQLTKPNCVKDNLDDYFVHFVDGYDSLLPIISFFVIYYDFIYHHNSGEIVFKGYKMNKTYTYDKNNDKYQKDFIRNNFGENEELRLNNLIKQIYSEMRAEMRAYLKKFWLIFGCAWGVVLLAAAITIPIILYNSYNM